MPEVITVVLRRYAAAATIAGGFVGSALLTFFGLIAVTGCFISCSPNDEHPEGALLVIAAIMLVFLASPAWADTIGPIGAVLTLAALTVPPAVSGTRRRSTRGPCSRRRTTS